MPKVAGVLREIWRGATTVDGGKVSLDVAVRGTVGVAIPLIVGQLIGHPLVGVAAATGALQAGFASFQGSYRSRAGVIIATAIGLAVAAFLGGTIGHVLGVDVVVVGALGFAAGLLVCLGPSASVVGLQVVVILVVYSQFSFTALVALQEAGLVMAGAALQLLLVVVVWPFRRFPEERKALSDAYRQLADYASTLAHGPDVLQLPTALQALEPALRDPQPFAGEVDMAAHQALATGAGRIRLELTALSRARQRLEAGGARPAAEALAQLAIAAAAALTEVSEALREARIPAPALDPLARMERAIGTLRAGGYEAAGRSADALAGQVRAALRIAAVPVGGDPSAIDDVALPATGRDRGSGRRWFRERQAIVRANLTLSSQVFRHGLRLAVALMIAVGISHFIALQHRYWLPLTVMIVLRADFSSTFTRGVSRIVGTLIGAGVVTVAIGEIKPGQAGLTAMVIVFAFGAFSTLLANYAIYSVCIASLVVTLLAFTGQQAPSLAEDRTLYTVAGAGLALVVYLLWPTWEATSLPDRLADLVATDSRYVGAVFHAWADPAHVDRAALERARLDARLARTNAEAAVARWLAEPQREGDLPRETVLGVLAAVVTAVRGILTLHAEMPPSDRPHPEVEPLAAQLSEGMAAVAESLRGQRSATSLPPLRETQLAMARQASGPDGPILVSETDLITDGVDTLGHLVGLLPAT